MTTKLALVDGNEKVETCSKHGGFTATVRFTPRGERLWSECPGCERELYLAREAKYELERRLSPANIPPRFFHKRFADYNATTDSQKDALAIAKDFAQNFAEHLEAGRCAIFSGRVGCGKTHLSCSVLRGIAEQPFIDTENWRKAPEYSVKYTTVREFIREIRSTWDKRERCEADAFKSFARPHLLVLDEVGAQSGSEDERRMLEELLDMRYRGVRSTIVCTNLAISDIPKFIGERGYDRLRENCGVFVLFDWESHRGKR
jgi:DNA replication protein DnaC